MPAEQFAAFVRKISFLDALDEARKRERSVRILVAKMGAGLEASRCHLMEALEHLAALQLHGDYAEEHQLDEGEPK